MFVFQNLNTKYEMSLQLQLTAGALAKICRGEEITGPVLQVLGYKPIQGSGQER